MFWSTKDPGLKEDKVLVHLGRNVLKLLCLPLAEVPDYSLRVSYMKDLVRSLPLPNHNTMELLFKHLRR